MGENDAIAAYSHLIQYPIQPECVRMRRLDQQILSALPDAGETKLLIGSFECPGEGDLPSRNEPKVDSDAVDLLLKRRQAIRQLMNVYSWEVGSNVGRRDKRRDPRAGRRMTHFK